MSKKKPKFETIGDVVRKTRADKPEADAPAPVAAQPKKGKTAKKAKQDDSSGARSALSVVSPSPAVQPQSNEKAALPTSTVSTELEAAFNFYNNALFADTLPPTMLRLERLPKARGYFRRESWAAQGVSGKSSEIVLDPTLIRERTLEETLSTLVHEQVHLQDFANGTAPKRPFHGKSWCELMHAVGLTPVILDAKGVPTGRATGPNSTHTIDAGGKFEEATKRLLSTGFKLTWSAEPLPVRVKGVKKKAGGKFKYEAECGNAFWAKPGLSAECQCGCESKFEQVDKVDGDDD